MPVKYFFYFVLLLFMPVAFGAAHASALNVKCLGNIETFKREIINPSVSYNLWYDISGSTAKIRFAGREFESEVARSIDGRAWKGRWLRIINNEIYFSYLPDEGGTIKFEFSPDRWFSGNCK